MSTQVIHHHHVARPQRRPRDLLNVNAKHLTRRRPPPRNRHQRLEARKQKRPDQRHVNPGVAGHGVTDAPTSGGRPYLHVIARLTPRFINKRQALEWNLADLGAVVLGGLDGPVRCPVRKPGWTFFVSDPGVSDYGTGLPS